MLWTLMTPSGQRVMCYAVAGDEGLAITVERAGEIVLAEMASDIETATARAAVVREALVETGLSELADE
jgi:hypothetical protein